MSSSENISLAVQNQNQNQKQQQQQATQTTQTTPISLRIQHQASHSPQQQQQLQINSQHQQQIQNHQQQQPQQHRLVEVEEQQVYQHTLQTIQANGSLQSPLQQSVLPLQHHLQQHQQQQIMAPQQQVQVQIQVQQANQQLQQQQQDQQNQVRHQQQLNLQHNLQMHPQIQHQMDDECKDGACNTRSLSDYLAQLLKDRKQLDAFPNIFLHVERLLEEEITNVRASLFSLPKKPRVLPPPEGPIIVLNDKVYVPVKEYPDFNFVGRLLGPRGLTAKQLEADTGCKIMVRGKGSMRNKEEEDNYRGKPNYEHLNDELHILISVEDTENRAKIKLEHAVLEIKKILIPSAQGEDELKKRQLMELAIINGTYRDTSNKSPYVTTTKTDWRRRLDNLPPNNHVFTHTVPCIATKIRGYAPATIGTPLIISPTASVTPFENPSTHMILVPCGDCANYATFTSNALLTDNSDKNPMNALKEQRRIINATHINRSLAGVASKNGFRAN